MASATGTDAAVRRHDHAQFVDRFLAGLTNALQMHQGQHAAGVTRQIAGIAAAGRSIKTSQKVVDARMALGADDALYLQSGLGLLWAGDDTLDDEHLLFPSSMGNAAIATSAREALKAGMASSLNQQIKELMTALDARLPALVYLLSLPEVGRYVRGDLHGAGMLPNAPKTLSDLVGWLVGTVKGKLGDTKDQDALAPNERHDPRGYDQKIGAWIDLVQREEQAPLLEELITFCVSLRGLYAQSDKDTTSPMALADLYTSAAVDVALVRDWSTAESVMRARRARNAATADKDNEPDQSAPPTERTRAGARAPPRPRPNQAEIAEPGLGPSLPTRTEPAGAGAEGEPMLAVTAPPKKARTHDPDGGEWMAGLMMHVAEVGAHEHEGGQTAEHDKVREHRFERDETQAQGALERNLDRLNNLVLDPLFDQMRLSVEQAASPLWSAPDLNLDQALAPTRAEIKGVWNTSNRVEQRRATWHTVALSLYDGTLGPYRAVPEEITDWLTTLPASTAQALPTGGPAPGALNGDKRGVAATEVMRAQTGEQGYSEGDNRFVSYAVLRGLTADYGPHEVHGPHPNKVDSRLRYWRGATVELAKGAAKRAPPPLPASAGGRRTLRAPAALVEKWSARNNLDSVAKARDRLVRMIVLRGPLLDPKSPYSTSKNAPQTATEVELWRNLPMDPKVTRDQHIANTLREVRWAPVSKDGNDRSRVVYNPATRAASAAATYEHLLATMYLDDDEDGIPKNIRPALRAALKLRQLPHMLAFDAELDTSKGDVQAAMAENVDVDTVQIYDANRSSLYRTLLPTQREVGDHVWETMPPALSGVWRAEPLLQTVQDTGVPARHGGRGRPGRPAAHAHAARARAPKHGVNGHQGAQLGALGPAPAGGAHALHGGPGANEHAFLVQARRATRPPPQWLNSDARVKALIGECYRLAMRVRELRLQRDAFGAQGDDDGAPEPAVSSLVERERRGAIWEDALREMAISSDRLYNFLRTVSGTLHEDIQAVVEVEASLALKPHTLTPGRWPQFRHTATPT